MLTPLFCSLILRIILSAVFETDKILELNYLLILKLNIQE